MNGVRAGIGRVVAALAALVLSGCAGSGVAPSAGPSGTAGPSSAATSPAPSPSTAAGGWAVPAEFLQVDGDSGQRLQDVVSMSMYDHSCAVRRGGSLVCWGRNDSGQVGDGTTTLRTVPVVVAGLPAVVAVAAGDTHTCAVTAADASVRCWGANEAGQLGDGTRRSRWVPAAVPGLTDVRALAAAESWACAVVGAGEVRCWGTRAADTRGADPGGAAAGPTVVPGISDAATVDIAHGQACATTQAGGVRCWGYGGGLDADTDATLRSGLRDAVEVASGGYFGPPCIRTSSGRVVCEAESAGASTAEPTPLLSRDAVVGVDPSTMTCIVPDGGALTCRIPFTGPDGSKQVEHVAGAAIRLLAQPTPSAATADVNATATPGTPSPLRQVAAGESTVCAVLASTDLRCWGELRPHGQSVWEAGRAASSAPDHPQRPAAVPGIAQATWVAVAADHACAVRPGGAVACWGSNAGGVFGVNPGWVPVAIPAPRA